MAVQLSSISLGFFQSDYQAKTLGVTSFLLAVRKLTRETMAIERVVSVLPWYEGERREKGKT